MKVLVTGCAGFIGSHLCHRLLSDGFDVIGIDCLTDYYDKTIKMVHVNELVKNKKFSFAQVDLLDVDIHSIVKDVEIVFHLAAQPGVRGSWGKNFDVYVRNNIISTQKLLEHFKEAKGLKKFVYASSSSVYGHIMDEKVTEDSPTHPYSPYGVTKLAAEHLCSLYNENFGVPTVSLRLFTVYGPNQRPDMAFSRLIRAALTGTEFTLYGDGTQERDFTFVLDVVDAVMNAAGSDDAVGVYNVAGGSIISMNNVIQLVQELTGQRISIRRSTRRSGDVRRTSADISKIKAQLAYRVNYDIHGGLLEQIESQREELSILREIKK